MRRRPDPCSLFRFPDAYDASAMRRRARNLSLSAGDVRWHPRWPILALALAALQIAGAWVPAFPPWQDRLAVAPDAIFRRWQVWRLVLGPIIAGEFSWIAMAFMAASILTFGWHLELTQARRRLLLLYFGGSVFAAGLWSIAALVWDWNRPFFSPVGATVLATGTLAAGLRRPFPAFLPYQIPAWVAFVVYVALWQFVASAGAIDLSAQCLAGLFAILVVQSGGRRPDRRTSTLPSPVTTPPEEVSESAGEPEPPVAPDPEFDRRVDDLLRKITENGYDSLAEDEIALLLEASQRYRNRPPPSS